MSLPLLTGALRRARGACRRRLRLALALPVALLASMGLPLSSAQAADITVLHAFTSTTEGSTVYGQLIEDPNELGTFYGMTTLNAASIWKMTSDGTLTVLYTFATSGTGLRFPYGGLYRDASGMLYGTTYYGGSSSRGGVFRLDPVTKTYTVLHEFTGTSDGAYGYGTLVEDSSGDLWGVTQGGGPNGYGVIYKMAKDGTNFTLMHSFTKADGQSPYVGMIVGSDGALYGLTNLGGDNNRGVIFRITTDGSYSLLYSFPAATTSLGQPTYARLLEASDGKLYGTTKTGGTYNYGGVFTIAKDGTGYQELYLFTGGDDGRFPQTQLVEDTDGGLLGTAINSGENNYGEIFRIAKDGSYTGIYPFTYYNNTYAALLLGSDGLWYGATSTGNSSLGQGSGYVYTLDFNAAAPLPSIDMTLSASTIRIGDSATLVWETTNAKSCTAGGDWAGTKDIEGGESLSPTSLGTFTYELTCSGSGGRSTASVELTVTADPSLQVTLTAQQDRVFVGEKLRLSWTTVSAQSCEATGDWSGSMPVNGAAQVRIEPGRDIIRTFTLSCTDAYGETRDSTVTVGVVHDVGDKLGELRDKLR